MQLAALGLHAAPTLDPAVPMRPQRSLEILSYMTPTVVSGTFSDETAVRLNFRLIRGRSAAAGTVRSVPLCLVTYGPGCR
jgi:hypothetical protein